MADGNSFPGLDGDWLEGMVRQMGEVKAKLDAEKPVASLSDVLVRDPDTGERKVFDAVTEVQEFKIRFKPMTVADLASLKADEHDASPVDWSVETKAGVLARNLVEPDLVEAAGGKLTAEWLSEHLEKAVVDDLVTTIHVWSQPRFRVPPAANGEKKSPPTSEATSTPASSSGGSTTSATRSSAGSPPTDSP